jgi:hypothetical protein
MGKDVEGSYSSLSEGINPEFSSTHEVNHKKMRRWLAFGSRSESQTSRKRSKKINHTFAKFNILTKPKNYLTYHEMAE